MEETFTKRDFLWLSICLGVILSFVLGEIYSTCVNASDVISLASTFVSIALSVIAMVYTFTEGVRSSALHKKMEDKLEDLLTKVSEQKEAEQQLLSLKNDIEALKDGKLYDELSDGSKRALRGLQEYFDSLDIDN